MPPAPLQCRTMPPFNNGKPLRVVRIPGDGRFGVVDEERMRVWMEHDLKSSILSTAHEDAPVIASIPDHYGRWTEKPIGGVSKTVRRDGCIRTRSRSSGHVVVFATNAPNDHVVATEVGKLSIPHTVGDTEVDEEYGNVTEVVVHDADHVDYVCAVIARCGATPVLEHASTDALRGLGIERLDRIGSQVVDGDDLGMDSYGVRRGSENWKFPWMPPDWTHVPITWDHLVKNVAGQDIGMIPQPLRQHVAISRLQNGDHETMGSRWRVAEIAPTPRELEHESPSRAPAPLRTILRIPQLSSALSQGRDHITDDEMEAWGMTSVDSIRFLVQCDNGTWYRPRDTQNMLRMSIPGRRLVSAALTPEQSKQLITAFYLMSVEHVPDPDTQHICCLILYRYMVERGYTARWMGKYVQDALFIGNGIRFRNFRRLSQYDPERLPIEILNKICGRDGRLKNRGSKGTRSKYRVTGRYVPKRHLKRSADDEARMNTSHA